MTAPPYLTDAEIAEICRPRIQGAAQIRYLRALGLKVERRADGTPLVTAQWQIGIFDEALADHGQCHHDHGRAV